MGWLTVSSTGGIAVHCGRTPMGSTGSQGTRLLAHAVVGEPEGVVGEGVVGVGSNCTAVEGTYGCVSDESSVMSQVYMLAKVFLALIENNPFYSVPSHKLQNIDLSLCGI